MLVYIWRLEEVKQFSSHDKDVNEDITRLFCIIVASTDEIPDSNHDSVESQ
jgi:hypothetical protein